jgi:hypothetical protein
MTDGDDRKVYLMDVGEHTKIGYATDPESRRSVVQSHNHSPVTLSGTIETDDAPRLERTLHTRLSEYRCQTDGGGEWFSLPDDIHKELTQADYLSSITLSEKPTSQRSEARAKSRRDRRMKQLRTPIPGGTCIGSDCSEPPNAVAVLNDATIHGALDPLSDEWATHLFAGEVCAHCFAAIDGHEDDVDPDRLDRVGRDGGESS